MATLPKSDPAAVIERIHQAQNQHDIDGFVACFAPDYSSEQPVSPDRAFRGRDQVRKNWSAVFKDIPDFRSDILRVCVAADTVWTEWHWYGTLASGGQFDWRGVTIFGVQDDHITWGRLYMAPVQAQGAGIDATVQHMTHGSPTKP